MIGAGPAGLSVAYHLRRLGHQVRLVDSAPQLGGMMRFGIPSYRLPRDILDAEIERIVALGVDVELDHPVDDIEPSDAEGGFDAVFLAVGASWPGALDIPSGDSLALLDAVSLLHQVAEDDPPRSAAASPSTAAATPRSTRRAPPAASAPPTPSSSTAGTAGACPHTTMSSTKPWRRASPFVGSRRSTASTAAAW